MAIPPFWPFEEPAQFRAQLDSSGSPQDQLASFAPDIGPPITRRRTTARVEQWNLSILLESVAQLATFETWFNDTLKGGSLPFTWRRPSDNTLRRFMFAPATYTPSFLGATFTRMNFTCLILPGAVPLAPYVPEDRARLPDFVADYTNNLFWLNGDSVAATALSAVTGDYTVLENDQGTLTYLSKTYAGDVPQTAPFTGVEWIAGWAE